MKILGICGSLRNDSYNLKLLKSFQGVIAEEVQLEIAQLHDIPLYNGDVEATGIPVPVDELAKRIKSADALLFSCPEYNYSIPGVLKNAIDWVSRHPEKPFQGKIAAMMGASPGRLGTSRAQYHLRQVAVFLDIKFLNRPEVMVGEAHNKFSPEGVLTDEASMQQIKKLADALTAAVGVSRPKER